MQPRKCRSCPKLFYPITGNQVQCHICRRKKTYYIPAKPTTIVCKQCGENFETHKINKVYCSDTCRNRHNYTYQYKKKKCRYCKQLFSTPTDLRNYCSREHYIKAKRIRDYENYRKLKDAKLSESQ